MSNRYFRAVGSNFVFLAVNTLFFLVITPVAIKVMGTELFGLWAILNAILLLSLVGTLGMEVVVSKFGSEAGDNALDHSAIITAGSILVLPMATLTAGTLLALRGWISDLLQLVPTQRDQFAGALVLTALSLFPLFLSRVLQGYLFSQLRFDLGQSVVSGANIALWSGAVWLASTGHNLLWMAGWGLLVQAVACCGYIWLVANRGVLHWRWEALALRRMANFSLFTLIQSLAISLSQHFDRILVGFILGPAAAGVYAVGTSVGLRLSIVVGQATSVIVPYASRKESLRDRIALYAGFRKVSRLVNLSLALIASLMILWMDVILAFWISPEYSNAYSHVFRILLLAYLFLSASRPGHQTLTGIGKIRLTALIYLSVAIIMLVGLYFSASFWGLAGAAASNLLLAILLIYNLLTHRLLGGAVPWRSVFADLSILALLPLLAYLSSFFVSFQSLSRLLLTIFTLTITFSFLVVSEEGVEIRKFAVDALAEYLKRA